MDLTSEAKVFRVVMVGDTSVGKTSIITRLVHNMYNPDEASTVGAMFVSHMEVVNNEKVEMQVWDTAGQEKFRSLGPIYYRNAAAAVVVFDLTNQSSFDRIDNWIASFTGVAGENAFVYIVGNKADQEESIVVPLEQANEFAKEHHCHFTATSAKTGFGIKELFQFIARDLVQRDVKKKPSDIAIDAPRPQQGGEKKCCK